MSASERLKALEKAIRAVDVDDMDSIHTLAARNAVVDALPELIAVVEAVENALDQDYGDGPPTMEIGASLAALDAKLSVT